MAELGTSEPQLRAAIEAEGAETRNRTADDGEGAELRALTERASLGAIFTAAIEHRTTDGPTAELQEHLKLAPNQIPLALLRDPKDSAIVNVVGRNGIERRAVTPAPSEVGQTQSTIIPGVFPRAAATWLSVDMPTVGVGDATFPVLTTNAAPGTPAKGAAQAETTGAFTAELLTPGRIQASFFYNREDRARFMGMDEALRVNLSEALSDKLDAEVIAQIIADVSRTAASGAFDYAAYKGLVYGQIDGTYAWGAEDIRVLVGAETLETMATTYLANSDSMSSLDQLSRRSGGVRVSAHIPAAANNKQDAIVRRGMRRDAVCATWEGIELIPDEVTKASTGQIVLTAVMLHAKKVLRADGFKRIEVQLS
ncbi:MAG: hypothetical protein OXH14_09635 [Alphaproteobacteria bacterium]|nr:hypothetical protein [Alphaproteobacteria bacterium]